MEPDISPLAKRLAEENNVNWRGLGGSGANGRIVERDVLEYLAKVMAGEEDVNPTAEPVPEGMDAWPEEDTAGYFSESSPSIKATDTLTEVVTDMPSVSVEEASTPFSLDEDPGDLEPEPISLDSSDDMFADMDSPAEPMIDDVASTFGDTQEEVSDVHISEDIFLFDDDNLAEEAAESDVFASSDAADTLDEAAVTVDYSAETQSESTDFGSEPQASEGATFEGNTDAFDLGETEMPSGDHALDEAHADAFESLEGSEAELDTDLATDELFATPEESSPDDTALFSEESSYDEPQLEETSADVSPLEPIAADVAPNESDIAEPIESETFTPAPPLPTTGLPLSSFGVLLRRHADLGPAMGAQLSISHELGQNEEPIALSTLLVRAAAKALQTAAIDDSQGVGLVQFDDHNVTIVPVTDAHTTPFRELVAQLGNPSSNDSLVGLAVADMSDLGVDEAVLNLDVPVLALGRILQDSEQGSQHSTLTLSGNVPVEAGTQFLSAVAELIASPIRLVL